MADKDSYNHKWSEITLLPEWEEEFYNVYRAKKYGKWVMLKCLKPEYAERPEFQVLIEKEFDARYNLAHANIAMINDFEPIEGLGQCIITDNVYGKSLRELIDSKDISPDLLAKIQEYRITTFCAPPTPPPAPPGNDSYHGRSEKHQTYRRGF